MQTETIKTWFLKLGKEDLTIFCKDNLKDLRILDYRNNFGAHTPNRKIGKEIRSFILCRISLKQDVISGYSLGKGGKQGNKREILSLKEKINTLINEWDQIFLVLLNRLADELFSSPCFPDDKKYLLEDWNCLKNN